MSRIVMAAQTQPRTLQTVETTLEVVKALSEIGRMGPTELANHLGISKGAAYNHLATLREHNYAVKRGDEYELALQFLHVGETVKHRHPLYRAGKEETENLAESTGEHVHLMTEEGGRGVYLHQKAGKNGIVGRYMHEKFSVNEYLHFTSLGKAIMGYLSEEQVRDIVQRHGLPERTNNTITDPDALFKELEEIRDRGFALNDEEQIRGARAVGVPIFDTDEQIIGAISVSAPTSRLQRNVFREEMPERVKQSANIIEVNLATQTNTIE